MSEPQGLKIAVVGAGVAGLTAAHLLQRSHEVTLFEKNNYLGGHTNTVVIPSGPDAGTPVDTGFIVFNDRNYPNFIKLLASLGIQGQPSDMSFGFTSFPGRLTYNSYVPGGLLAQKRNLLRPAFIRMVLDILRFNRQALDDLRANRLGTATLGEYLDRGRFSAPFRNYYLVPMGAAIWSTPQQEMLEFPAESFIRFFDNHGLLVLKGRPNWMTVPGGSQSYVRAIRSGFRGRIRSESPVKFVRRGPEGAVVGLQNGSEERFDRVVIAAHADEALGMLADPSDEEKKLLGAWRYTKNLTILHTDDSLMPWTRKSWASWNYTVEDRESRQVTLTYHMNRLQSLKTQNQYFVTLNPKRPPADDKVIMQVNYTHPSYTTASLASQKELPSLNGKRGTFFCGSYFGYGFHEDAVKSALQVTQHFGVGL